MFVSEEDRSLSMCPLVDVARNRLFICLLGGPVLHKVPLPGHTTQHRNTSKSEKHY